MFKNFRPEIIAKTVFDIPYGELKSQGVDLFLFDLDNTLAPVFEFSPSDKIIKLIREIRALGGEIAIVSNNTKTPERVSKYAGELGVFYIVNREGKTKEDAIAKAIERFSKTTSSTIMIGDFLFMDIVGANKAGAHSALVDHIARPKRRRMYFMFYLQKIIMFFVLCFNKGDIKIYDDKKS